MKEDRTLTKEEFIGRYMESHIKNNTLPYGLEYLSLRDETEEKAIKMYNRYIKRYGISKNKG